ncbi:MAG: hypothetical protein CMF59_02775 [Leptospiraceae bacterium]|nr:hypothetical protein [Leptospiraceae bacterium]
MKAFMISIGNFFFKWRDTVLTLILIAALILVAYPGQDLPPIDALQQWKISWSQEILISIVGLLILIAGQIVRAVTIGWAYIKRGGLNKKIYAETLVRKGMFAHSRNPLYLGNLLIATGALVSVNQFWYWVAVLPLVYFLYYCIIFAEEKFLRGKFGAEYEKYEKEVNRLMLGNLKDWSKSTEGMTFTWKRLINKEHGSFVVIFTALALYNLLKFHFRHGLEWTDLGAIALYAIMGLLLSFQVMAALLKRMHKLEWDPARP